MAAAAAGGNVGSKGLAAHIAIDSSVTARRALLLGDDAEPTLTTPGINHNVPLERGPGSKLW